MTVVSRLTTAQHPMCRPTRLNRRTLRPALLGTGSERFHSGRQSLASGVEISWLSARAQDRRPRTRLMASERVAALRMMPRTAEVTVLEPGLRTPRIDIHRCSASTTTSTPGGLRPAQLY